MVTNLPHEAKMKWNEVTLTKNPENRLILMGEFLSLVPKHKGTEKLCRQVKRQMAQIRDELEKKKKQLRKTSGPSFYIQKTGVAQIAIIGPSNVGRSSLLRAVTNSTVEITPWPFGTDTSTPGMLSFEDIQFQLVEIPPIISGSSEGRADGFKNLSSTRNADGIIIMLDLTEDPVGNYLQIIQELENARILTFEPRGEVEIQRRGHSRGIQFIWDGELDGCTTEEITRLLRDYKIWSALVRIRGKVSLDLVEDAIFGNAVYRPTIVLANKSDVFTKKETLDQLKQVISPLKMLIISAKNDKDLTIKLGKNLFQMLKIIRIYTKEHGKKTVTLPIVAKKGITVGELAKIIHNDFYDHFKYARIWGPSAKFPNEKVGIDRELDDGTIIQIYT